MILLPSASCSLAMRTFIGTIARRPCAGSGSPRPSSSALNPLAVIVSATSLMVPPSEFLIARMSSSGIRTTSKRRRVPMGSFRLVLGAP